jgi:hypothetical protein
VADLVAAFKYDGGFFKRPQFVANIQPHYDIVDGKDTTDDIHMG